MKLYEIAQTYQHAFDEMSAIEGLPEDVLSDTLEGIEGEFNDKAIAITSFFKNMEAETKAMKEAEDSIKARRVAIEKRVNWMKDYLLKNMQATGITKISCPYFDIAVRKNPASVQIKDETAIPAKYKTTEFITKIDKAAIKKDGGCTGVELVQGESLSIK